MELGARTSTCLAACLVMVGLFRLVTDTLHEFDPNYWRPLHSSALRYLVRAPSDGSWPGWLNAQCFKILAVPAGLSLIYLRTHLGGGTPEQKAAEFRDTAVRGVWIATWLAGFTILELEKAHHFAGMRTRLVHGESSWLNHVIHGLSALMAWRLSGWLGFGGHPADRS